MIPATSDLGPVLTPIVMGLVVVVMIVVVVVAWRAARKRRQDLAALAGELGGSFHPAADRSHDDRYRMFGVFRKGDSRVAFNTITADVELYGAPCFTCMGDFRYTTGSGKNRSTHHFSYLVLHMPFPSERTPDLLIRPEGIFDKLASVIGFDDIDFESAEFSKRFHVKSGDKRFAYDVVHPRMMEFLMAETPCAIDIEQGCLCLSNGRSRWSAAEFRAHFDFCRRFLDLWPEHVTRDLLAGSEPTT